MRIGIVNDMAFAAEALGRVIAMTAQHQVAWIARDGAEAVARCAADRPDLVLMDLIMPGMDGVEATRHIMANSPCAILIVTASINANSAKTFAAMGHGALDAVDLPQLGSADPTTSAEPLLRKIQSLSRLVKGSQEPAAYITAKKPSLIAIGASAGGPAALAEVLRSLPRTFPAAIVIVQHVDERFAPGMADWLDKHSSLPVKLATDSAKLVAGEVLLAGTSEHLVVGSGGKVYYTAQPIDEIYRPSINVFFHSICALWDGEAMGVLLTGMGSDGAVGLKAMRNSGYHTITQDSATSAVFGMPKAAAAISAAVDVLPLPQIAPALVSHLRGKFR